MKKLLLLVLLLSIALPSCKKKVAVKPGTVVQTVGKPNVNSTTSEDADEFALEDDASFNVFEDDSKKQVETQDLDEEGQKLTTIQFDYDDTQIKPSQEQKIQENVKFINKRISKDQNAKIAVQGHSCKIAKSKEYNYTIAQERAQNVAQQYKDAGVPAENLKPVGYGDSQLVTNADGMQAQAPNRRVETVI